MWFGSLEPRVMMSASIGDFVWNDKNADGIQGVREKGLAGIMVELQDAAMNTLATTATDANGKYLFDNLAPGDYYVKFTAPSGPFGYFIADPDLGGDDAKDSDADPITGRTGLISLSADNVVTIDAGMTRWGMLSDFVWEDLDADGLQEAGEPGIKGVSVELYDEALNLIDTTTTSAKGKYIFDFLKPGNYLLKFIAPDGLVPTLPNVGADDRIDSDIDASGSTGLIFLRPGLCDRTVDAGFYRPARLGDFVWEDLNQNGQQDANEPGIEGVTVNLKDENNNVIDTTTTDADGFYIFENLVPGTYSVAFVKPNGFEFTTRDQGSDASDSDADDSTGGMTHQTTLLSGDEDLTLDAGLFRLTPGIMLKKFTNGVDADTEADAPQIAPGDIVTWTYKVTNTGNTVFTFSEVEIVDDAGTASDPSDDFSTISGDIVLVAASDLGGDGILSPGEMWIYEASAIAQDLGGTNVGLLPVSTSLMNDYLLIGTTSNSIAKAVNVQNGELGADAVVLSTEINDNVDFDLKDVFLNTTGNTPGVWIDNDPGVLPGNPDFLPGAAGVHQGISWTGDVALTSPNATFDMSNVELFGQVGVVADSGSPVSSVSNSFFFPNGVGGNAVNPSGGQNLPPNGVTANADAAMAALRTELDTFEDFVTNLAPEVTLTGGSGLPDFAGIEDEPTFVLNIDPFDTNGDGLAVIDILIDNGNSDFKLTNSNWIIDGDGSTFAVFRIRGDSNLVLNQSTIVLGDGGIGGGSPVMKLGAIFVKAAEFSNGQGGFNAGESLSSGDTVFSFNDTVLNGVGFYDLIVFDENNSDPQFDNGTTELKINNGQGCAHFISPKINFNDVRFERCDLPESSFEPGSYENFAVVTVPGATDTDLSHYRNPVV
jgi:protocatechuate 3,4-dioxygenase beta subunit